jgi:hypothetical protein
MFHPNSTENYWFNHTVNYSIYSWKICKRHAFHSYWFEKSPTFQGFKEKCLPSVFYLLHNKKNQAFWYVPVMHIKQFSDVNNLFSTLSPIWHETEEFSSGRHRKPELCCHVMNTFSVVFHTQKWLKRQLNYVYGNLMARERMIIYRPIRGLHITHFDSRGLMATVHDWQ